MVIKFDKQNITNAFFFQHFNSELNTVLFSSFRLMKQCLVFTWLFICYLVISLCIWEHMK